MTKAYENQTAYVVCIDNTGYKASLEKHKIYRLLPDEGAEKQGEVRVIDESGEDYLYDKERFVAISVPAEVEHSLEVAE